MEPIFKRAIERYGQLQESVSAPDAKPLLQQIREIVQLRRSNARMSAAQYFWMNLGSKKLYQGVDLENFGGTYHTLALHRKLNSPYWDAIVTDKLVMSAVFSESAIPQPEMYAAACRFKRAMGDLPIFNHKAALLKFIREGISYPFFCKPVKGNSARGCQRVESYNDNSGCLVLANGSEASPEDFVDSLRDLEGWGFLFQEAVLPHPATRDICGKSVSGCRVILLVGDNGPKLFRVVWKLPANGNHVDNHVRGTTGNSVADVDIESGRVKRLISGAYTELKVNPLLPGCERDLVGEKIPDWEQLKSTVESAALCFPGFRFQHWDVGLTSKGPVVYELNTAGGLSLTEVAKGSGIFDDELMDFLEQYGNQATRWHLAGGAPVN